MSLNHFFRYIFLKSDILTKGGEIMPKIHDYYQEMLDTHYGSHLEMCSELGLTLDDLYTNELEEDDFL